MTSKPEQIEADPPVIPDLRCMFCAEPVMHVTIPNFSGWVHDYGAIQGRLERASDEAIMKALEADPARCCNDDGFLNVNAGTYDSKQKKYATKQEHFNKFKVLDHALKVYFADEIRETGATWAAIVHASSDELSPKPKRKVKAAKPKKE